MVQHLVHYNKSKTSLNETYLKYTTMKKNTFFLHFSPQNQFIQRRSSRHKNVNIFLKSAITKNKLTNGNYYSIDLALQ